MVFFNILYIIFIINYIFELIILFKKDILIIKEQIFKKGNVEYNHKIYNATFRRLDEKLAEELSDESFDVTFKTCINCLDTFLNFLSMFYYCGNVVCSTCCPQNHVFTKQRFKLIKRFKKHKT
ncbi:hypothetical protein [Mesoplasma melaleucae]|uniref:Uncharacterized protein n=1 Tax=Mesoplasma melaleucae TaxID=81459 RepID=A0A2K8NW85_9MOLU|nr:hypothetical protein [Mesoplasma melaleucae]ATZ18027.1 hypothetical protein EMELA_v1c04870 [Mesoplasma melaleucae]